MTVTERLWEALLAANGEPLTAVQIAAAIDMKASTAQTTLNAMSRAGLVHREGSKGGRTFQYNTVHKKATPKEACDATKAYLKERNRELRGQHQRWAEEKTERPVKTRVLLTVEVPGSDTVTWDMDQAKHIYETLKEMFG